MAFYGKLIGKNQRIKTFETECAKLFNEDKRFEAIYPGKNFDFNKQIILTYDTLHLIWGKNGFLQKGVKLNWGEFSELAAISRSAYNNLKLQNYMASINDLAEANLSKTLNAISETYDGLGKNIQKLLEKECNNFPKKIEEIQKSTLDALCEAMRGTIPIGLPAELILWMLLGAVGGLSFAASAALATAIVVAVATAVGLTIAGIGKAAEGIAKIEKTIKEENLKKKLEKMTEDLTEFSKQLKKAKKTLDKFTKVENVLRKFISEEQAKYRGYCFARSRKLKKCFDINNNSTRLMQHVMDGQKYIIAKMITNITLNEVAFKKSRLFKIKYNTT